jgi:hypothetical protein
MSYKKITAMLSGAAMCSLGLLSLVGYCFHNVGMYAWGGTGRPGMGLNTALGFFLGGLAITLLSLEKVLPQD